MGSGLQRNALRPPKDPVVCGRQERGRRSPGGVSLFDSAIKLAHSKRFASSEAPWGVAAADGLRRLAAAVCAEPGWSPAMQG